MTITSSGSVGIGLTAPSYLLEVNGTAGGTSAYQVSSDKRFKREIQVIPNALEKISALFGVTYKFRNDEFPDKNFSHKKEMGVIAQEVEKVFPEAVSRNREGYRSVAYTMLIAPIIEAIKELKEWVMGVDKRVKMSEREIASLKVSNSELILKNKKLESEVEDMKKRLNSIEQNLKNTKSR